MPVTYLELENFKSYGGKQRIGPFGNFTSVIGPNGSGKSNLMDAMSFVLGVQSRDLRSSQLKDLIHRPPTTTTTTTTSKPSTNLSCSATLVYQHEEADNDNDDPEDLRFTRTISPAGVGTYKFQGRTVPWQQYEEHLMEINVLVQARNFLVFQGDVEGLARKTPAELTALLEEISGSRALAADYDAAAAATAAAEQDTLFGLQQKKGLRSERKLLQEQKQEAERFDRLQLHKRNLQTDLYLWLLYHLEQDRGEREQALDQAQEELQELQQQEQEAAQELQQAKKHASSARRISGQADKKRVQLLGNVDQLEPALLETAEEIKTLKKRLLADEKQLTKKRQEAEKHVEKMEGIKEEIAEYQETYQELEKDYQEIKRNASPEEGVELTAEQEEEYERVREAAAAANAQPRRVLTGLNRKLESARNKADSKSQKLQEAQANSTDTKRDVEKFTERRDKLTKVCCNFGQCYYGKVNFCCTNSYCLLLLVPTVSGKHQEGHGVDREGTTRRASVGATSVSSPRGTRLGDRKDQHDSPRSQGRQPQNQGRRTLAPGHLLTQTEHWGRPRSFGRPLSTHATQVQLVSYSRSWKGYGRDCRRHQADWFRMHQIPSRSADWYSHVSATRPFAGPQ